MFKCRTYHFWGIWIRKNIYGNKMFDNSLPWSWFLEALFVISCYVLHVQLWYIKSIKSLLRHITISERYSTMGKYIAYLSTNGPCSSIFQSKRSKPLRANLCSSCWFRKERLQGLFSERMPPLQVSWDLHIGPPRTKYSYTGWGPLDGKKMPYKWFAYGFTVDITL